MHTLGGYDLVIPQFPNEEEWQKTIADTIEGLEGLAKDAAIARIKGLSLLGEINEKKATPERVAIMKRLFTQKH